MKFQWPEPKPEDRDATERWRLWSIVVVALPIGMVNSLPDVQRLSFTATFLCGTAWVWLWLFLWLQGWRRSFRVQMGHMFVGAVAYIAGATVLFAWTRYNPPLWGWLFYGTMLAFTITGAVRTLRGRVADTD